MVQPKKVGSSVDKQYWAKGTGFGTGSTVSSYNMHALRAKHQLEEKYVSICFAILAEYLSVEEKKSSDNSSEGNGAKGKEGEKDEEEESVKEGVEDGPVKNGVEEGSIKEDLGEGPIKEDLGEEPVKESVDGEEDMEKEEKTEDFCSVEVLELLCRSCLLPSLASCLLNDSGNNAVMLYS